MPSEMHSSLRLVAALEEAGFGQLAKRARTHEFHDFLSPHALPQHELVAELRELPGEKASALMVRVIEGDFDATKAESDEWANSPEGQAALDGLTASSRAPETGIEDENHALLMGHIFGALMRLAADSGTPTQIEPIYAGPGVYTNRVVVKRASGDYTVTVVKGAP